VLCLSPVSPTGFSPYCSADWNGRATGAGRGVPYRCRRAPRLRCRGPREFVVDMLRDGAGAEVVGPEALRQEVAQALWRAAGRYGG